MLLPAFLLPKGELSLPLRISAFFGIGLVLYFALLSLELKGLLGFGAGFGRLGGPAGLPPHSLWAGQAGNGPVGRNWRAEPKFPPAAEQPIQHLLIPGLAAKRDFRYPAAILVLPLVQPNPEGRLKIHRKACFRETHVYFSSFEASLRRRDNQGGRLLAGGRAPAPRLPDGDCVFISACRYHNTIELKCTEKSGRRR